MRGILVKVLGVAKTLTQTLFKIVLIIRDFQINSKLLGF